MPTTTIQIEVEVRDQLRARGHMGESYNDVIRRLLAATRPTEFLRPTTGLPATNRPHSWVPLHDRE